MIETIGSVCSGIGAASVAWEGFPVRFLWRSEIAPFPSRVLRERRPDIPNLGDMNLLPGMLRSGAIEAPDLICGGTPCQAFSPAGWKGGLDDDRGGLTLRFVDVVQSCDEIRLASGRRRSAVLWENVEGVLNDRTNAFGLLVSSLAGLDRVLEVPNLQWPKAGLVRGRVRNLAWRVLDAKHFGIPQQRRRLYLVAGGKDSNPEDILFERRRGGSSGLPGYPEQPLAFEKEGHAFEVFRAYTDCLYSAYGTKWNGNAAARNGSLFVVQDQRIRRFSPLEAERLMGFPDGYTCLDGAKNTCRYQSLGNSWAAPVVRWIGRRLFREGVQGLGVDWDGFWLACRASALPESGSFHDLGEENVPLGDGTLLNCSPIPEEPRWGSLRDILSPEAPEGIYLSPVGCHGILRRSRERRLPVNPRLEEVLLRTASQMSPEEIEKASRVQRRGRRSTSS